MCLSSLFVPPFSLSPSQEWLAPFTFLLWREFSFKEIAIKKKRDQTFIKPNESDLVNCATCKICFNRVNWLRGEIKTDYNHFTNSWIWYTSLHLVDNWPLNFKQHIWHCCFPHNFVKNLFPFCTLFQCANAGEMKVNWNESRGNATRILNFCIFILSCKSKKSFQDVLNFLQNWVTITFWKHNSDFGCFNFCF